MTEDEFKAHAAAILDGLSSAQPAEDLTFNAEHAGILARAIRTQLTHLQQFGDPVVSEGAHLGMYAIQGPSTATRMRCSERSERMVSGLLTQARQRLARTQQVHFEKLPSNGLHLSWGAFVAAVSNRLLSSDGIARFATAEQCSDAILHVLPGAASETLRRIVRPAWATHVVWIARKDV